MINIRLVLDVCEYYADVYRNSQTGELAHAEFPAGVVNDVNYGGSIRAFLFLLNNECCTSIDKSRKFLLDLTGGKLNISKGMVSSLCREFAMKTEQERKNLFADMLLSPVMHTDCTNAKVNGKPAYVFVCATPDGKTMYFARDKKGHEGVKGTVAEDYQGILVHDHERTFYNYGTGHQEGERFKFHYQSHGYHPLVCYDGITGDLLKIELRNGTDYSCTGVVDFLQPLLDEFLTEYPEIP